MALWLFSVSLLMLYFAQQQRKLRGREIHSLPRKTINRAAYHCDLRRPSSGASRRAISSSMPATASSSRLCVITATMMAGAAFVFAPIPAAAAAYVVDHGRRRRRAC